MILTETDLGSHIVTKGREGARPELLDVFMGSLPLRPEIIIECPLESGPVLSILAILVLATSHSNHCILFKGTITINKVKIPPLSLTQSSNT